MNPTPIPRRHLRRTLDRIRLLGAIGAGTLLSATAAGGQSVAITNARILPVSGPAIEKGTLVIRDGKIAAVGADVSVPAGARVIDGTGKTVTPGFLNSSTQVGIVEVEAVSGTNDTGSGDDDITAAFDVVYGLDPNSTRIPVTREGGVTRVIVAPSGGTGLIGGRGALIRLAGDRASEMVIQDPVAMFGILGEGAAARAGGARGVAVLRVRELLDDARDYLAHKAAFEANGRYRYGASRLDLEALGPVVAGRLPLALQVDRASDIENALQLAKDYRVKLILLGAAEGWEVADDIAKAGVPVVVNPLTDIPQFEEMGATLENAARLAEAGVDVAFATLDVPFPEANAGHLRYLAGNAVSYGMPYAEALEAVTATPARIWGVADRYGTLEPGKDADVVVWSGDPFELLSRAERVFIGGQEMPGDNRQKALLDRYRTLPGGMPAGYRR
jgi:imidazolonepropionase-like amidohydrolase